MKCERVELIDDRVGVVRAIVCSRGRPRSCVGCGRPEQRACDWKLTEGRRAGKTCDRAICESCTTRPAPDKDLCPKHAALWATHPKNPRRAELAR